MKTDKTAEVGMHVFERAGLGKAPFRVVGFEQKHYCPAPGVTMVGGSCDYCGTGIVQMFYIRGADGRRFKVGCDCVVKTGDAGLIKAYKKNPAYRKMLRDARHNRENAKLDVLKAEFDLVKGALAGTKRMINGSERDALDYYEFVLSHCGTAGKLRWYKAAIKAAKGE